MHSYRRSRGIPPLILIVSARCMWVIDITSPVVLHRGKNKVFIFDSQFFFSRLCKWPSNTFLGAFAKSRRARVPWHPSVCPHATTRHPLDGFSRNLTFGDFSKIFRGNSSLIKIWQEEQVLYMKTFLNIWQHLAEFFWKWEMFQMSVVNKIKTYFMFNNFFFLRKSCRLWDNVEKYSTAREATDDSVVRRMRCACWINNVSETHSEDAILTASVLQQRLHERASVLRYTYIASLVLFRFTILLTFWIKLTYAC